MTTIQTTTETFQKARQRYLDITFVFRTFIFAQSSQHSGLGPLETAICAMYETVEHRCAVKDWSSEWGVIMASKAPTTSRCRSHTQYPFMIQPSLPRASNNRRAFATFFSSLSTSCCLFPSCLETSFTSCFTRLSSHINSKRAPSKQDTPSVDHSFMLAYGKILFPLLNRGPSSVPATEQRSVPLYR